MEEWHWGIVICHILQAVEKEGLVNKYSELFCCKILLYPIRIEDLNIWRWVIA